MKKKTILLFGGSGMLGTRIKELLYPEYNFISPSRAQLNLKNEKKLLSFLENNEFDTAVYAAGLTNQDIAEKEKVYANLLNARVPELISKKIKQENIPFIYFSTDAVFPENIAHKAYSETDTATPVNYYGYTKAKGEVAILKTSRKNTVIRLLSIYTNLFKQKNDFVRKAVQSLSVGKQYYAIEDQYINPTFSDRAAIGLGKIIEKNLSGIYHIAASDCITNYNFMLELAGIFNFNKKLITPVSFSTFYKSAFAKRGQFCCLETEKTQKALGKDVFATNIQNLKRFYDQYSTR